MVQKAKNARARFQSAALALFEERGVSGTTVSEIAARAQLTERTFYRYFSDKREVLFWRADEFQSRVVAAVERGPGNRSPLTLVIGALEAVSDFFDGDRATVMRRMTIVATHAECLEREMLKMQTLTSAIRATLEARGVDALQARMASEVGVAVSRIALERWITDTTERDLAHHIQRSREELDKVVLDGSCRAT